MKYFSNSNIYDALETTALITCTSHSISDVLKSNYESVGEGVNININKT
jgi:hypothetical protein